MSIDYLKIKQSYSDQLYHHGVKGQKWGVRNEKEYDPVLRKKQLKEQKKQLKEEKKQYKKEVSALARKMENEASFDERYTYYELYGAFGSRKKYTERAKHALAEKYPNMKVSKLSYDAKVLITTGAVALSSIGIGVGLAIAEQKGAFNKPIKRKPKVGSLKATYKILN